MRFGKIILSRRREMGLTAEDLAKRVGVNRTYISKIETHNYLPSLSVMRAIAKCLEAPDIFTTYLQRKFPELEAGYPDFMWTKEAEKYSDNPRFREIVFAFIKPLTSKTTEKEAIEGLFENSTFKEQLAKHKDAYPTLLKAAETISELCRTPAIPVSNQSNEQK